MRHAIIAVLLSVGCSARKPVTMPTPALYFDTDKPSFQRCIKGNGLVCKVWEKIA